MKGVFDDPRANEALQQARRLVPKLEDSPQARTEFVKLIRGALPQPGKRPGKAKNDEDASDQFFKLDGNEVMKRLERPVFLSSRKASTGGAAAVGAVGNRRGGAANILIDGFTGMKAAAERLLNYATYYQMKERRRACRQQRGLSRSQRTDASIAQPQGPPDRA